MENVAPVNRDSHVISTPEEVFLMNVAAGRVVAEAVGSALGPRGMNKLLVDSHGFGVVSNDGTAILDKLEVSNPVAKMILDVANAMDKKEGDGTISAIVLVGELLRQADALFRQAIHPTVIVKGYALAAREAIKVLRDISMELEFEDDDRLCQVALTALGDGVNEESLSLARVVVDAVRIVAEKENGRWVVDPDRIHTEMKEGANTEETTLVKGMILDRRRVNPRMPKRIKDARILMLATPLIVRKEINKSDTKIRITDPKQMKAFVEAEEKHLRWKLDKVLESGANVVFCEEGIDDHAQYILVKAGIMGARRLKSTDMKAISEATGATVIRDMEDFDPENDLGRAGLVEEVRLVNSLNPSIGKMIFIRDCPNPKSVAIQIRGGTQRVVTENERMVLGAIKVLAAAINEGRILAGGGAPEAEAARRIRKYAHGVDGKEQLAILAFADSLEAIPRRLAKNAGANHLDAIIELTSAHENGGLWSGIDSSHGKISDMLEEGVIEPLPIKETVIQTAASVVNQLLRIDGIYNSTRSTEP